MNTGQIIKSKSTGNFTVIKNDILKNSELSLRAKGLLCFLLSLSNDFIINKTSLHKFHKEGRDACVKAFNELVFHGYILQIEIRNGSGHFKGYNYIVYDEQHLSEVQPITENPISENPISENPALLKKQVTKESINQNINVDLFNKLWNKYGKVGNKQPALKQFSKLSSKQIETIEQHIPTYHKFKKQTGEKLMHFSTYINQQIYLEDYTEQLQQPQQNTATFRISDYNA